MYRHVADNGLLFISGQLGFDVEHDSVIPETVEEQATLSLKNLDAIMTAAGTDRTKVMKTTIFLTDMNDFAKVNEYTVLSLASPNRLVPV